MNCTFDQFNNNPSSHIQYKNESIEKFETSPLTTDNSPATTDDLNNLGLFMLGIGGVLSEAVTVLYLILILAITITILTIYLSVRKV
jgi:hypothetical protein